MTTGPSMDQIGQIAPLEIVFLDEVGFPISIPLFELFLATNCILGPLVGLNVDQSIHAVFADKFRALATPVLIHSGSQAVRDANIQRGVPRAR
jgi:hypothetical protein